MFGMVQAYKLMKSKGPSIIALFFFFIFSGIIHRDIKPANILIHHGVPKLADFGFATTPNSPPLLPNVNVGSPLYMCPQALKSNKYSEKSDIWALGISAFELLYSQVPWTASHEKELANKILQQPLNFPTHANVSEECKDFIRKCLKIDEFKRTTISELLYHQWIIKCSPQTSQKKALHANNVYPQRMITLQNNIQNMNGKENASKHKKSPSSQDCKEQSKVEFFYLKYSFFKPPSQVISKQSTTQMNSRDSSQEKVKGNYTHSRAFTQRISQDLSAPEQDENRKNDYVIMTQINYCRYLYRVSSLLEQTDILSSKNKMICLINTNIMMKITKLKEMIKNKKNHYNLDNFMNYFENAGFRKIEHIINCYFTKYSASYVTIMSQQNLEMENNFSESDQFYLSLMSNLKQSIKELETSIKSQLWNGKSPEHTLDNLLGQEIEQTVVLLDYLVTYFQLCSLILDTTNNYYSFSIQSKLELIADGQPVRLSQGHFVEIQNKIISLEI